MFRNFRMFSGSSGQEDGGEAGGQEHSHPQQEEDGYVGGHVLLRPLTLL